MEKVVKITPRFVDPDAPQEPRDVHELIASSGEQTYIEFICEYKYHLLAFIFVVIIACLIIYFVFRTTEKVPAQSTQSAQGSQVAPSAQEPPVVTRIEIKKPSTWHNLLQRSKDNSESSAQAENSKTEEEIMNLMEESTAPGETENFAQGSVQNAPQEELNKITVEGEADITIAQEIGEDISENKADEGCIAITTSGRRCKNKAVTNNKCKKHDKVTISL